MFKCWKSSGRFFNTRHCLYPVHDFFSCWLWTCSPSSRPSWKVSRRYFSPSPLLLFIHPFSCRFSSSTSTSDDEFSYFSRRKRRKWRVLKFAAIIPRIIHAGGRLQVWIMCCVTDGIDTFADSRFEFRWIFVRRSAWSFACVYVDRVGSSRRCSGDVLQSFVSTIRFVLYL